MSFVRIGRVVKATEVGFMLGSTEIKGGICVVESTLLRWQVGQNMQNVGQNMQNVGQNMQNVGQMNEPFWSTQMFFLFELLKQKPAVLVIGSGSTSVMLPVQIRQYLNGMGIQTEVTNTVF
jgi:hypothetical protein